jgi:hypothetical protein
MSSVSTPYGLVPKYKLGFTSFNGAFREFPMQANNSAAIFNGDLVVLSTAGQPSAQGSSPVAFDVSGASDATAGIMGVCVGCRYVDSNGQVQYNNFVQQTWSPVVHPKCLCVLLMILIQCTKSKELPVSARSTAEQTALVMQALSA